MVCVSVCDTVTVTDVYVCMWSGVCVVCVPVCDSVTVTDVCVCMWSGVCVVCVPVCDTVTLSHCHTDNDKLLLFTVTHWPMIHYDSVYRWRPHCSRHQVLQFIMSVTHKMRFVCGLVSACICWEQWDVENCAYP